METADILKAFETVDGVYKHCEVDEALKQQKTITPHLIEILKKVLVNPGSFARGESDDYAHIYAVMLLGYFREAAAHETIVRLFSFPGELPHVIFGDIVTEELNNILYRTANGKIDLIKSMILDTKVNEYCRAAAIESLVFFVVYEEIEREEVTRFLDSLFDLLYKEEFVSELLFTSSATAAHNIFPEELMDKVDEAYEEGCIASFFVCRGDFDTALKDGKKKVLEQTKSRLENRYPEDFHDWMSSWSCFKADNRITGTGSKILYTAGEKNKQKRARKKRKKK